MSAVQDSSDAPRQVGWNTNQPAPQSQPSPKATGPGRIIFGLGGNEGFDMINPDGTNRINLTDHGNSGIMNPSVSSSTGMIAFEAVGPGFPVTPRLDNGDTRIFVMNSDGTGVRQITFAPNPGDDARYTADFNPRISPDGTKVAFISKRKQGTVLHTCNDSFYGTVKEQQEVFVVNTDGTGLEQVTQPQIVDTSAPSWINGACGVSDNYVVAWTADSQLVILGQRSYTTMAGRDGFVPAIVSPGGILYGVNDPGSVEHPNPLLTSPYLTGGNYRFLDVAPDNRILFAAEVVDPFFSQYENSNSLGIWMPGARDISYLLTQNLMGQVGYNGTTDGKPHGGSIEDARFSPDGTKILIKGVSPLAGNDRQTCLFIGGGSNPLLDSAAFLPFGKGMAWEPGPSIPKPDKLVLSPNPIVLYNQNTVQVVPSLLDAQGNTIVHAAQWRSNTACPTCGFRCDPAPDQIKCVGQGLRDSDIDFTGRVGWHDIGDSEGNLCAANGGLKACIPWFNSATRGVATVEATTPVASVHNAARGVFTIKREVSSSGPAAVSFTLGGTATRDVDYTLNVAGNSVTMTDQQTSVTVSVQPTGNSFGKGDKTVMLTLQQDPSNAFYVDSLKDRATVTLKDDGAPPVTLSLSSVAPNKGGDTGVVTATAFGTNIKPGASITLRRAGLADITGTNISVAATGTYATASFDLTNKQQGAWDVVVTNPDNTSAKLAEAFTIEASKGAEIWADFIGRYTFRSNLTQTFYIAYGNSGNVDADPSIIQITVPAGLSVVSLPTLADGSRPTVTKLDSGILLSFLLDKIPAGSSAALPISLRADPQLAHQTLQVDAWAMSSSKLKTVTGIQDDPTLKFTPEVIQETDSYLKQIIHVRSATEAYDIGYELSITDADADQDLTIDVTETGDTVQYIYQMAGSQFSGGTAGSATGSAKGVVQPLDKSQKKKVTVKTTLPKSKRNSRSSSPSRGSYMGKVLKSQLIDCLDTFATGDQRERLQNLVKGDPYVEFVYENTKRNAVLTLTEVIDNSFTELLAEVYCQDPGVDFQICESGTLDQKFQAIMVKCQKTCPIIRTGRSVNAQAMSAVNSPGSDDASCSSCTSTCEPFKKRIIILVVSSLDPNEKDGPQGAGEAHFINGALPLNYVVSFENQSSATAPAQTIIITDQLDTSKLELSTFSLGAFGFGSTALSAPGGLSSYSTDVDLRPANNLLVHVSAQLDKSSGLLTWTFTSIDPATGKPTTDPLAGFLPPNKTSPEGQGSVTFSVMPKVNLAAGTEIRNRARIVFDRNAPIDTNEYLNTIDNLLPSSKVSALAATQPFVIFPVSWSGTDTGSGIKDYRVYVSENGGAYAVWLDHTAQTSAYFIGQPGKAYGFYTVATDNANNREAPKSTAEATTATPTNIQNSLDDSRFFVWQQYLDFLSRTPDIGGLDYWTSQLTACGSDQNCLHNRRVGVSNAFYFELEYQQTAAYVFRLYRAAYGNNQPFPNPDTSNSAEARKLPAYAPFTSDRSQVVGGTGLAASQLALANHFVQRAEFLQKYPASLTGPQFVDALLATIKSDSGVDLISQRDALLSLFNSGGRGAVLYRLADDNAQTNPINNRAFIDAEYNRSFVYGEYAGYLRRDSDIGGFLFWLNQVNRFPLRSTTIQNAMVCSFITSAEYQLRFGTVVTHTNQQCPQ